MGLFDGTDEEAKVKQDMLMAAAAQMFMPGSLSRNIGQGINASLIAGNNTRRQQRENKLGELQAKAMEQRLADAEREQKWQQAVSQGYRPGAVASQMFAPGDMETPSQFTPAQAPGFDFSKAMALDPLKTMQIQQSMNKQEAPQVLKPGEAAYDRGGKRLYGNDKPTNSFRMLTPQEAQQRGLPAGQGYQLDEATGKLSAVGSQGPTVNVGGPVMEKEENKQKAAYNMDQFKGFQSAKQGAIKENSILTALERNPVDTNKLAPITSTAKAWLVALGAPGDTIKSAAANAQSFNAAATELVMNKQMLQKGPQTESDARRLEATVANLGNVAEANKAIIAFAKEQNNRAIRQADFYDKYWRENKTLEGADAAWSQGEGGTSIWDSPALKNIRGAAVIDFNNLPKGR